MHTNKLVTLLITSMMLLLVTSGCKRKSDSLKECFESEMALKAATQSSDGAFKAALAWRNEACN